MKNGEFSQAGLISIMPGNTGNMHTVIVNGTPQTFVTSPGGIVTQL